jgi:hypothetical protein
VGVSATVIAFPKAAEPWVSKKQVAAHYSRSIKWVEKLMREGMRFRKDTPTSCPMFRLSEVDERLRHRHAPGPEAA